VCSVYHFPFLIFWTCSFFDLRCSYCPVDGPFDPSPFWPTADQREKIKDLGKETVNGVEVQ